jgi:hypothetical protein
MLMVLNNGGKTAITTNFFYFLIILNRDTLTIYYRNWKSIGIPCFVRCNFFGERNTKFFTYARCSKLFGIDREWALENSPWTS